MKIYLKFASKIEAEKNKAKLIKEVASGNFATWAHKKSADGNDVIYHTAEQYISDPSKNVIFAVSISENSIVLSTRYWNTNPRPTSDMYALHTGRLVEMLLKNNYSDMTVNK